MFFSCENDESRLPPIDICLENRNSVVGGNSKCFYEENSTTEINESSESSSSSSSGEVLPTCEDFMFCALECGKIEYGDNTEEFREICVNGCDRPSDNSIFFDTWGADCANNENSLCNQGLISCEIIFS